MTTHNSYHWSLIEQLNHGIRGFELDIHDNFTYWEKYTARIPRYNGKGKFKIGHVRPNDHVIFGKKRFWDKEIAEGNPTGNDLEEWLRVIADWSKDHEGHVPITVFLDLKKNLTADDNKPPEKFGLDRLEEQIRNACGSSLFTPRDFDTTPNPTIDDLREKIIVVLMSFHTPSKLTKALYLAGGALHKVGQWFLRGVAVFSKKRAQSLLNKWAPAIDDLILPAFGIDPNGAMKTRLVYQEMIDSDNKTDPACCVAFNPEDRNKAGFDASFEDKSFFVTPYPPEDYCAYWKEEKIVRTDYKQKDGKWPPKFPDCVNFPATDTWREKDDYHKQTDWVKDKWMKW